MKTREAAIIGLYTGTVIKDFSCIHAYAEELIGRPIFTHEFADKDFSEKLKELAKKDLLNIKFED